MHVGADYHYIAGGPGAEITGRANLAFNTRLGVRHLTAQVSGIGVDGSWDLDELKRMRDNCDTAGVVFEAIRMDSQYIMLAPGAARDRRLDAILGNIEKAAQVGTMCGWPRTHTIRRDCHSVTRARITGTLPRSSTPTNATSQSWAFAYGNGYIRALIHAVNAEIAAS